MSGQQSNHQASASKSNSLSPQLLAAASAFAALSILGCGQTGLPSPPSLYLPQPIADLAVSRSANQVHLTWTMPSRTTDRLPLKTGQFAHICRKLSDGPCQTVADTVFDPDKPVNFDETLPPELTTGPLRPLIYIVQLRNRKGQTAGDSNPAYTAAGAAPPPVNAITAEATGNGVLLHWQPSPVLAPDTSILIHRVLVSPSIPKPAAPKLASKDGPFTQSGQASLQSLRVPVAAGVDPGRAFDRDAAFNRSYGYRIARLTKIAAEGHTITVTSTETPEIPVDTKDRFPPSIPTGLAAVAVADEAAIDLSWEPDTEPDLAGYFVYRHEAGTPPRRISSASVPLHASAFRDSSAQPGHEYLYYVTAIDRDKNESGPSAEIKESLPPKP